MLSSEFTRRTAYMHSSIRGSDLMVPSLSPLSSYFTAVHQSGELEQTLQKAGVLLPVPPPSEGSASEGSA